MAVLKINKSIRIHGTSLCLLLAPDRTFSSQCISHTSMSCWAGKHRDVTCIPAIVYFLLLLHSSINLFLYLLHLQWVTITSNMKSLEVDKTTDSSTPNTIVHEADGWLVDRFVNKDAAVGWLSLGCGFLAAHRSLAPEQLFHECLSPHWQLSSEFPSSSQPLLTTSLTSGRLTLTREDHHKKALLVHEAPWHETPL